MRLTRRTVHDQATLNRSHQFSPVLNTIRADTYLPRNGKRLVQSFRVEEPIDIFLESLLELFLQYNVLPISLLNLQPQRMILLPPSLVVDVDLLVKRVVPDTGSQEEGAVGFLRTFMHQVLHDVFPEPSGILANSDYQNVCMD